MVGASLFAHMDTASGLCAPDRFTAGGSRRARVSGFIVNDRVTLFPKPLNLLLGSILRGLLLSLCKSADSFLQDGVHIFDNNPDCIERFQARTRGAGLFAEVDQTEMQRAYKI